MKKTFFCFLFASLSAIVNAAAVEFPAPIKPAQAEILQAESGDYWIISNNLFSANFKKSGEKLVFDFSKELFLGETDELFTLEKASGEKISSSQMKLKNIACEKLQANPSALKLSEKCAGVRLKAEFEGAGFAVEWSAVLRDFSHYLRTEMKISAKENTAMKSVLALNFATTDGALKIVGNTRGAPLASEKTFAALETPLGINAVEGGRISGLWSRNAELKAGETWTVSAVVGLIAPQQQRRSFLAYHERERAVPWRSFVHYNSWYELNINRKDHLEWFKRTQESECIPVISAWRKELFVPYGVSIDAFVWDDGWDDFSSLWGFHKGFPNGFSTLDKIAKEQNAGQGAWLGPVGGYGESKRQRLNYWNTLHPEKKIDNFELSHPDYFNAFLNRCADMVKAYDMRYFKFDGISDIANAVGPRREEDAEGFLRFLTELRKYRADLFFNCTVGSWASPFWFQFGDAVWRQDQDWATVGDQGDERERWITYRDHMVYKNFTVGSPLCPINSLMTHGLIVSAYGDKDVNPPFAMPHDNSDKTAEGIIREMRCAFACGSAMVELYLDHDLMTNIGSDKRLWRELATCIKWHRANADLLPDTHWVGGNPWDGNRAEVYGWASWNGKKSALTLRNPAAEVREFKTTLRSALDIPPFVAGKIRLTNAFHNQTSFPGITGEAVDIDQELSFLLLPFDVVVLDGVAVEE